MVVRELVCSVLFWLCNSSAPCAIAAKPSKSKANLAAADSKAVSPLPGHEAAGGDEAGGDCGGGKAAAAAAGDSLAGAAGAVAPSQSEGKVAAGGAGQSVRGAAAVAADLEACKAWRPPASTSRPGLVLEAFEGAGRCSPSSRRLDP